MKRWMACLWVLLVVVSMGAVDLLIVTGSANIARLASQELHRVFGDRLQFASIDASISGEITLYGARIKAGEGEPLLEIPKTTLHFSKQAWLGSGTEVRAVTLHQPHLRLDAQKLMQVRTNGKTEVEWPAEIPPVVGSDGILTLSGMGFFDADLGPRIRLRQFSLSPVRSYQGDPGALSSSENGGGVTLGRDRRASNGVNPVPSMGYYLTGLFDGEALGLWDVRGEIFPAEGRLDMEFQSRQFRFNRDVYLKLAPSVREAWDRYAPSGPASWKIRVRKSGPSSDLTWAATLFCEGTQGTFREIPYTLEGMTGEIDFTEHGFTIKNVQSRSGSGTVTLRGLSGGYAPSVAYEVAAEFERVDLDAKMYRALPETARKIWDDLRPAGQANIRLDITRPEGELHHPQITVRSRVIDATMEPRAIPLRWEKIEAELVVRSGRLEVPWMSAQLSGGTVTGSGRFENLDAELQADLALRIDSLDLSEDLRKNLAGVLGDTLDRFQPSGRADVELFYRKDAKEGGHLKTRIGFREARMGLGVPMDHVTGAVTFEGNLGAGEVPKSGSVRFSRADIHGRTFRNLSCDYQIVGAMHASPLQLTITDIRAELCGGIARGRATMDLKGGAYEGEFTAHGIDLTEYVHGTALKDKKIMGRLSVEFKNLRGNVNDAQSLRGEGSMTLSEGEIWDVPILYNVLTLNLFNVAKKPALKTGQMTFELSGRAFQIGELVLEGEGMKIQGKGKIHLNGTLDLLLSTQISTSLGVPGINLIEKALDLIKDNLYAIEVGGTFEKPEAKAKMLPSLTGDK